MLITGAERRERVNCSEASRYRDLQDIVRNFLELLFRSPFSARLTSRRFFFHFSEISQPGPSRRDTHWGVGTEILPTGMGEAARAA